MAHTNVITLGFNEFTGEPIEYKKLSARLPAFLAKFPPADGYSVTVEYFDPIEVKPGLGKLYEACLAAGNKPESMGLPPLTSNTMIFRASLVDNNGRVLGTGSALILIHAYKDWEKGETAARQRLLAALGFGGDVLDDDENTDQRDQGLIPSSKSEAPAPSKMREVAAADDSTTVENVNRSDNTAPTAVSGMSASHVEANPVSSSHAPVDSTNDEMGHASEISDSMLATIVHQAKIRNVSVPRLGSKKEASDFLKQLHRAS